MIKPGTPDPRGSRSRRPEAGDVHAGERVLAMRIADTTGSAMTVSHTAVDPPACWTPTASSGPADRPPHMDSPNHPAVRPARADGTSDSTQGSVPENSAASPKPHHHPGGEQHPDAGREKLPGPPGEHQGTPGQRGGA